MLAKPSHLELYLLPDNVRLFTMNFNKDQNQDQEQNFVALFMQNFQEEIPCKVTAELYVDSYMLKFIDIDLKCEYDGGCKLGKYSLQNDICRLCTANFVAEEVNNI